MTDKVKNFFTWVFDSKAKFRWLKVLIFLVVILLAIGLIFNASFDLGWFHWTPVDPSKFKK